MNKITLLASEIVTEFGKISDVPVSLDDYLKIRASALTELERGFFETKTQTTKREVVSEPTKSKIQTQPVQAPPKATKLTILKQQEPGDDVDESEEKKSSFFNFINNVSD